MPLLTGVFSTSYGWGRSGGPTNFLEIIVDTVLLVSCQDIVTLTATVLSDIEGHTYFWQQISGMPVIWLEPQNQTDVTFQKTSTGDLVFRFWVDKDTPYEQYRDLIVTGTARDDFYFATTSSTRGSISIAAPMSGITYDYLSPSISSPGSITLNNPNKILLWTNPVPVAPALYTKTELYKENDGVLTLLATLDNPIRSYQNASINQPNLSDTYVFRSYWTLYNQLSGSTDIKRNYSSPSQYIDATENFIPTVNIRSPGSTTIFQTQIVSLSQLDNVDTVPFNTLNSSLATTSVFQTQIVTLTTIPTNLQDNLPFDINNQTPGKISIFQTQLSGGIIIV